MTPTLVRHRPRTTSPPPVPGSGRQRAERTETAEISAQARDWAEIQERMLVPLYEAVYDRLEVGAATRLLGLGCGSGLALLMAAARGARVTGADTDRERLALAHERTAPDPLTRTADIELVHGDLAGAADPAHPPYTVITAFRPLGGEAGGTEGLGTSLEAAVKLAGHGSAVVLTGWGPPERCATSGVLRIAGRLTPRPHGGWRPARRDDLEDVATGAGLRPDGSGRVACPFGYADVGSAVRGLLSTGLYAAAAEGSGRARVEKEIAEALHPYTRGDGTVWMPNVFRYLIARTP
ncbi:methyltransferase domain-containing protein [Streptomyces sp. NPDC004609]|uniref:methyltransferase domain-containing protein n=1 Tax=Streptomyces sp. NPDC004609 TaxID=3364704 RepID=UPI0036D178DE